MTWTKLLGLFHIESDFNQIVDIQTRLNAFEKSIQKNTGSAIDPNTVSKMGNEISRLEKIVDDFSTKMKDYDIFKNATNQKLTFLEKQLNQLFDALKQNKKIASFAIKYKDIFFEFCFKLSFCHIYKKIIRKNIYNFYGIR